MDEAIKQLNELKKRVDMLEKDDIKDFMLDLHNDILGLRNDVNRLKDVVDKL